MVSPASQIKFNNRFDIRSQEMVYLESSNPDNMPINDLNGSLVAIVKRQPSDREKMDNLIRGNSMVLMKFNSQFPYNLFPKEMVIDPYKVSLYDKYMLEQGNINSVQVEDLADIDVSFGLFHAKLTLTDKNFKDNPIEIDHVSKKEAIRAKRILLGLNLALRQKIDFSKFNTDELIIKIEELGTLHISDID